MYKNVTGSKQVQYFTGISDHSHTLVYGTKSNSDGVRLCFAVKTKACGKRTTNRTQPQWLLKTNGCRWHNVSSTSIVRKRLSASQPHLHIHRSSKHSTDSSVLLKMTVTVQTCPQLPNVTELKRVQYLTGVLDHAQTWVQCIKSKSDGVRMV